MRVGRGETAPFVPHGGEHSRPGGQGGPERGTEQRARCACDASRERALAARSERLLNSCECCTYFLIIWNKRSHRYNKQFK